MTLGVESGAALLEMVESPFCDTVAVYDVRVEYRHQAQAQLLLTGSIVGVLLIVKSYIVIQYTRTKTINHMSYVRHIYMIFWYI